MLSWAAFVNLEVIQECGGPGMRELGLQATAQQAEVDTLLHSCYTVVTLLYTAVTLLLHCRYTACYTACYTLVTLLLHSCYTAVTLLLHCCYTVVTLLSHCCHTVVTLLLHCCYTVVTRLLNYKVDTQAAVHHKEALLKEVTYHHISLLRFL
jgi:hypothetical protein